MSLRLDVCLVLSEGDLYVSPPSCRPKVFESSPFDPPRRLFGSVGGRLVCLSA